MEDNESRTQRGQSIVLVALVFAALILFVAIAVDMSSAYADRRQAQNAADGATLAAAKELGSYINGYVTSDAAVAAEMNCYAEKNGIADTDGTPCNAVNTNVVGCYLNADGNCLDDLPPLQSSFQVGAVGSIPDDAMGVEAVAKIRADTFFGGIIGLNGLPLQAEAASMFESACTAGGCVLPIAMHERGFDDEDEPRFIDGQCYNLWDGVSSANFGWLNWSLQNYSCGDLPVPDPPDDCSVDCVGYNMDPDHCARIDPAELDVGDDVWIGGAPGVKNADFVRGWLEYYITRGDVVRLVVYDESIIAAECGKLRGGSPSGTMYHLAGFSAFQLTGFRLAKGNGFNYCDLQEDGTLRCGNEFVPGLDYRCDPEMSLDYPPCYDENGEMVSCATQDSVTNRITGIARRYDDGDTGNCHAVGNLMAPRLRK